MKLSRMTWATAALVMGTFAYGLTASAETFYLQTSGAPLFNASNRSISGGGGSFTEPAVLEESGFGYDFRGTIGPVFWNRLLVGFGLNMSGLPLKRDAVDSGASSMDSLTKTMSYGPAIGFLAGGFHLIATGLIGGSQEITDKRVAFDGTIEGDFKWKNQVGLGYQIDIGYTLAVGRNFKIGPSLVYQKINYKRQTFSNAVDPSFDYVDQGFATRAVQGSLTPLISLIFILN